MTGDEHYREAENLLVTNPFPKGTNESHEVLAEAQVHATLALAAATAIASNHPVGLGYGEKPYKAPA